MANFYTTPVIHRINYVSKGGSDGSIVTGDGYDLGPTQAIRVPFAAGAFSPGDGYDVYVANANLPVRMRVLDVVVYVTTGAGTATLRDTVAGGGNALSDGMNTGSSGVVRSNMTGGTKAIAAGGTIVLRRSSQSMAGEVIVLLQPEAS